jgi:hypothetical protein
MAERLVLGSKDGSGASQHRNDGKSASAIHGNLQPGSIAQSKRSAFTL